MSGVLHRVFAAPGCRCNQPPQARAQRQPPPPAQGHDRHAPGWLAWAAAAVLIWAPVSEAAAQKTAAPLRPPPVYNEDSFENVPQTLDSPGNSTPRLGGLISGERSKEVQACTRKCLATCIRGGGGAPGLGPLSMRREIIVFKEGFRSRQYCLSECTQVCALSLRPPIQGQVAK
ncbi:hypothetical protein WJX72_010257 [[Myrmecia] bisecta]|uniref:Uncharacterized protein n=1 Tax=[Myrmecia] bisecta TaxID=41462 RepID=A0AAW1Q7N0_9CHLO